MAILRTGTSVRDIFTADAAAEAFDGLLGYDTVSYGAAPSGMTFDLATPGNSTGFAAGDSYVGIESFSLTGFADIAIGSNGNDAINGGAGDDTMSGGLGNDTLTGDAGNDTLYGNDGNDGFFGGGGNDVISGGNGVDTIYGDGGNDQLLGDAGNDTLFGSIGDDRLDGGAGNDVLNGEAGNDTMVVTVGGGSDTINGGLGVDTIEIRLTAADLAPAMRAEFASLQAFIAANLAAAGSQAALAGQSAAATMTLASLGLTLSGVENVAVFVDDVAVPLADVANRAPVADATATLESSEDVAISGNVGASDPDGDALTYAVAAGPAYGELTLNAATGAYDYVPGANASGSDSFVISVTDPSGRMVQQTINVAVAAVADAPALIVANTVVAVGRTVTGTTGADNLSSGIGNDTLIGGAGNDTLDGDGAALTFTAALAVTAALTDLDGSEALSVVINGVPAGATLSSGTLNADGSWSVPVASLAGLTLTTTNPTNIVLTVAATSTEATGGSAISSAVINVEFDIGTGADRFEDGTGNDLVIGGIGDDVIIAGSGIDRYEGGVGFDTVDYSAYAAGVKVDLSIGLMTSLVSGLDTDRLVSIEKIIGSDSADVLIGSSVDSTLIGGGGNDEIKGGAGNDSLDGGIGDDKVDGGSGNDWIFSSTGNDEFIGGSGTDTIDYSTASSAITVDISKSSVVGSAVGTDKITSFERVVGTAYDDVFKGSKNANIIDGGAGNDSFRGMLGADTYTGGSGIDTYLWLKKDLSGSNSADHVTDFAAGDQLDLSDFVGGSPVSIYIQVTDSAAGTVVSVMDGGGFTDVVVLDGLHGLSLTAMLADGSILV